MAYNKRWTRRHFPELLLKLHNYNVTITVSVSNVSYSTGRITRYNQFKRLFTCLSNSSSHSIEAAITIMRRNPNARQSQYRLQHRNAQIAITDNPADNPIRVSFLRSVSFC